MRLAVVALMLAAPAFAQSFDSLLASVKAAPFASDKLLIIRGAAGQRFTVGQVAALVDACAFASDKVAVVEALNAGIIDRHNGHLLYSHFSFASDRERVGQVLSASPPRERRWGKRPGWREERQWPQGELLTSLGRCLDAPAYANGTPLVMWPCHGGTNQRFTFNPMNGEISNVETGLCLNVEGGVGNAGDRVVLWPCTGGSTTYANQAWRFEGGQLVGMNGLCLDVAGGSTAGEGQAIVWPCHGGTNQLWVRQ